VTVTNVNEAPSITSSATPAVNENQTAVIDVQSTDPDGSTEGAGLTYSITGGADAALFSIVPSTGVLTFVSAPNFEAPGDANADNVYLVQVTVSDPGPLTAVQNLQVTVLNVPEVPIVVNESYDDIGNTLLQVAATNTATGPHVFVTGNVLSNDTNPEAPPMTAALFGVPSGGATVNLNSDGTFTYLPGAGSTGAQTFQYKASNGSGASAAATVTINLQQMVWYVKNDQAAGGLGRSSDPFDTLAEAQAASAANHWIFVFFGDGTTTGQAGGIALKNGQHLIGEFAGLSLPGVSLNGNPAPTVLLAAPAATACGGNPCRPFLDDTVVGAPEGVGATDVIPAEVVGLNLAGNVNALDWTTTAAFAGTGTYSILDNVVRSATNEGVDINLAGTGATSLAFSLNNQTSTGTALDIQETGTGALTIMSFQNNVVTGNSAGSGIVISTATFDATPGGAYQQVLGGTTTIGAPGNGVGAAGIVLAGISGDLAFTDLDIFADGGAAFSLSGTNAIGVGVNVGAGTGTRVTVGTNAAIFQATGGPAVDVSNATVDLQLNAMTSTNSASTGVSLVNVVDGTTAATFSAPAGAAITNATGTDFNVNGGNAAVTYNGTITDDVGQLVNIANTTADTKTFTGAITDGDDGDGSGVSLSSNTGATIRFTGGLVLSTGANPAFAATGGGTVEVCDEEPCNPGATGSALNKITTTTGTALNVANTTIGANQMEFQSISSNGAPNGIVLNNTGAGGLKVKGNSAGNCGGTVTVNAPGALNVVGAPVVADCTGGTIQSSTGAGISLTNTDNVSLTRIRILNSGTDGILISDVNGFTLASSLITDSSGVAGDRGIEMGDFSTGTAVNGTITVSNSTIGPTAHDNFGVGIGSGTSTWNITNTVFTGSTLNSGFNFEIRNATVSAFTMTGSVAQNQFADGMQFQPAAGVNATLTSVTIQTSSFSGNNIALDLNHDGSSNVTYKVLSNNFQGQVSHAMNVFTSNSAGVSGNLNARITGNIIGSAGTVGSGSSIGNGIRVNGNQNTTKAVLVDGNVIRQTPNGRGIEVINRNGTGNMDVTVTNNDVNPQDTSGFPLAAIFVQSNCVVTCNTARSDVRGNTVPAGATFDLLPTFISLVETGASALSLVDTAPASATCTAQLTSTNTGSASASAGCALIAGPIVTPP
jgi:hypothetical protein